MDYKQTVLNFYHNICQLRKLCHLSEEQMADIMGISVNQLRRIEKGDLKVRMNSGNLRRVCDFFHISSDSILLHKWPEK